MDRSILLHELVHYVQAISRRYADLAPCERRRAEEVEAYAVQSAYLASVSGSTLLPLPRDVYRCDD